MPGKEFEDFVAGKNFWPKSARRKTKTQKENINFGKPIRHEWFETSKINFEFLSREDWHSEPPKHVDGYSELQADVLVNFTDSEECNNVHECIKAVQQLQREHMEAGEPDIKQNFLVAGDGNIYEGRGWWTKPPFDPKWPDISDCMINIAYIGKRGMFPKKPMVMRCMEFITYGTKEVGCLQEHVGIYLDYFDEDQKMTPELYNYIMAKEDNQLDEEEWPKQYRFFDHMPWDKRAQERT